MVVNKNSILSKIEQQLDEFSNGYEKQIKLLTYNHQTDINKLTRQYETEKNQLITSYDSQMRELTNQLVNLEEELTKLKKEKQSTQSIVYSKTPSYKGNYEYLLNYIAEHTNGDQYDLILNMSFYGEPTEAKLVLTVLRELLMEGTHYEQALSIMTLLHNTPALLITLNREVQDLLQQCLSLILTNAEYVMDDEHFTKLYENTLELLEFFHDSVIHNQIKQFLQKDFYHILDAVFYMNIPLILTKYMRIVHLYNLKMEMNDLFYQLIEQWEFWDNSNSMEEFEFLLWFAYLYDFDEQLITISSIDLEKYHSKVKDLSLYYFLYDVVNEETSPFIEDFQHKIKEFKQSTLLSNQEQAEVLKKIEGKIKPLLKKRGSSNVFKHELLIITEENANKLMKSKALSHTRVMIPLYQKGSELVQTFAQAVILQSQKEPNQAYMIERDFLQFQLNAQPLEPRWKKYEEKLINQNSNNFKWPETEINEKSHDQHEDNQLKEKSDLKKMGYQITGLSRARRWEVLQKAVPALGLSKVAYTIASHIKLRKGQKNGRVKFQHSISEWEHDLTKLKQVYYKNNFKWPQH
ncbi:hypothetical protein ACIQ34_09725 [Ureibacillus sp. NPDC094379]